MCSQPIKSRHQSGKALAYIAAILLALASALFHITPLQTLGLAVSDIFIRLFKCISLPVISLSIIVTFSQYRLDPKTRETGIRILVCTLGTTLIAASLSCLLYLLIAPVSLSVPTPAGSAIMENVTTNHAGYLSYLSDMIPENIFKPFMEHQVFAVLLISIVIGVAIRFIPDDRSRETMGHFFKGIHGIFMTVTGWIVRLIPVALFGFITTTLVQFKSGMDMGGLSRYLSVVVLANAIQGLVILPLFLLMSGIRPFRTLRQSLPALSMAFFSKSSIGTLPVTIRTAEQHLGVSPRTSQLVLPLCTSINMNGCAAFIFATVIFVMQSHGVAVSLPMMLLWIPIATLAAIGNAGVPMGCFFLSASLLSSLNVPITLLGLILPFYTLIDMIETALNVWSDICITTVIDAKADPLPHAPLPLAE